MKKTLLILSLCASVLLPSKAVAQDEPVVVDVFSQAVFYGMYEGLFENEPVPEGAIRHRNWSYAKKLTQDQLDSFGNTLTATVTLNPLCDNYDRIGNVNMVFVPKGATSYDYEATDIKRFEIGRFITPFMRMTNTVVTEVPYVYELNHLTNVFHDATITADYDIWIELEVYGHQGDSSGGAAAQVPGCANRKDVYMGSLKFESSNDIHTIYSDDHYILPLSYKYELKNYTLDGTDVLGETVRTINFTIPEDLPNAKIHLITSNHGANANGEEYNRRRHNIYFDNSADPVFTYVPGGKSCEPYRMYNTQANGIYTNSPQSYAYWTSFNNWCPGDVIPNRVIELGDLAAGDHSFRIEVPTAVFTGAQGYFPMSVYIESTTTTLGREEFALSNVAIYPNPVNDVANIEAAGLTIKSVNVVNALGQTVYTGTSDKVNMSNLQSGIYIVSVEFDNNQTIVKKLIKK